MAFKFTVDYTRLRDIIDTDSLEPVSAFQNLQAVITHTELQSSLQYVNLSAVNVFLDPDSKNLYFVGANTNPGIGVPMCLISAQIVFKRIHGIKHGRPLSPADTKFER